MNINLVITTVYSEQSEWGSCYILGYILADIWTGFHFTHHVEMNVWWAKNIMSGREGWVNDWLSFLSNSNFWQETNIWLDFGVFELWFFQLNFGEILRDLGKIWSLAKSFEFHSDFWISDVDFYNIQHINKWASTCLNATCLKGCFLANCWR